MFTAIIITHLCSGWLCRAIHGDQQEFPLRGFYSTLDECVSHAKLVAELAGTPEPYRIYCKRADEK